LLELKSIMHKTAGPFLALENSDGAYALIDYIELGANDAYRAQALKTGATPNLGLISPAEWIEDETWRATPGVRFEQYADHWNLIRDDGERFAQLDASDLLALFRMRGL
jgi:hypothetical protein